MPGGPNGLLTKPNPNPNPKPNLTLTMAALGYGGPRLWRAVTITGDYGRDVVYWP